MLALTDLEKLKADDIPAPDEPTFHCVLCGHRRLFDKLRYSMALKVCTSCAEAVANLWHRQHKGCFLTWLDKPKYKKTPIPQSLRWEVFKRDGYRCKNCGSEKALEADHILAESRGGKPEPTNLRTLCKPCNSAKGDRLL